MLFNSNYNVTIVTQQRRQEIEATKLTIIIIIIIIIMWSRKKSRSLQNMKNLTTEIERICNIK